jgi:hypothetical protein
VTTVQALLVFLATPLAIIGLITGLVFAVTRRDTCPSPGDPPMGIAPTSSPCTVREEADGRRVHEPASTDTGGRTCWTLACAECRTPYEEGPHEVHFTDARQAITVARSHGWTIAGHRVRCPACA